MTCPFFGHAFVPLCSLLEIDEKVSPEKSSIGLLTPCNPKAIFGSAVSHVGLTSVSTSEKCLPLIDGWYNKDCGGRNGWNTVHVPASFWSPRSVSVRVP